MIGETLDRIGSKAAAIAVIYPIAIGLYAVGFFWNLPKDIIGFFDISAFLFKASIVYLSAVSFFALFFTLMAIIYSPMMDRIAEQDRQAESLQVEPHQTTWSVFSLRRKIFWVIFSAALILMLIGFSVFDPPVIDTTLDFLVYALGFIFIVSTILRPLITLEVWRVGKVLFVATFIFMIPILTGNSDARPSHGSPMLTYKDQQCPLIYVTGQITVADCGSAVAVAVEGSDEIRVWAKEL